ncbi:hypothetical protein C8J56DRAFT_1037350 [Mycena floridula]|nr:hypothetical protein C8J56DRAFT_1037350 [Mycena floridula]
MPPRQRTPAPATTPASAPAPSSLATPFVAPIVNPTPSPASSDAPETPSGPLTDSGSKVVSAKDVPSSTVLAPAAPVADEPVMSGEPKDPESDDNAKKDKGKRPIRGNDIADQVLAAQPDILNDIEDFFKGITVLPSIPEDPIVVDDNMDMEEIVDLVLPGEASNALAVAMATPFEAFTADEREAMDLALASHASSTEAPKRYLDKATLDKIATKKRRTTQQGNSVTTAAATPVAVAPVVNVQPAINQGGNAGQVQVPIQAALVPVAITPPNGQLPAHSPFEFHPIVGLPVSGITQAPPSGWPVAQFNLLTLLANQS